IGKLIAKLKSLGLYDNTLIVLTSDHGEMIGDKWMFGKGVPYEASVRVPCIIRDTDRYRGGKVHEGLVEHIDITASLLEYAGLTPPPQVAGRSLPVDTEQAGKDYVFSEMPHWKMIRTESYKLVQYNDGYVELFDLKSDPDETTNLYGAQESQALAMELTRKLLLHYV